MNEEVHDYFQQALGELRRSQERLRSVQEDLQKSGTKVTSKDRMMTVALDWRGEVASISFNTAKFRRMAPAELGAVLVETIRTARAAAREQLVQAYRPLMPEGVDLDALASGKSRVDAIFGAALARNEQFKAATGYIEPETKISGKG